MRKIIFKIIFLIRKHITRWIKEAREKYNQQKRITKDRILYAEIAEKIF